MFKRILVEHWQATLTVVSFAIFGVVFLFNIIRIARIPRSRIEQISNLPLSDDTHGN